MNLSLSSARLSFALACWPCLLASCSLVQSEGPPLESVWTVLNPIDALAVNVADVGGYDGTNFYAVRGRANGGRQLVAYGREDGAVAWSSRVLSVCSPPIPFGTRVYCPGDGIQAFEISSGRLLWISQPSDNFSLAAGTADEQRIYAGTLVPVGIGTAVAVSATTGALIWQKSFASSEWRGIVMRSLTLSPEGDLLIAFEGQYDPPTIFSAAVVVAVDPATGEERWRYVDGDRSTNREIGGLTLWEDLMLYSDPTGQEAVAVNRLTRQVVWRVRYTPDSFSTHRPPLVKDGVAFFTDTQGAVVAVDARTGQQRWRTKRPFGFLSHEVCGDIVFGNDQLGEVFDRATGRPLGRPLGEDDTIGQAAVADNVLYLSAASGVYAFDCTR